MGDTLAIVPARGGSKRIRRKNLRGISGQSLVEHAIEHAVGATSVDDTVLSTDDSDIATLGRQHDSCTVIKRPHRLASDTTGIIEVVDHVLEAWEQTRTDTVIVLQPTSPLRTPDDIDGTVRTMTDTSVPRCVSVSPYTQPPQFALTKDGKELKEPWEYTSLFDEGPSREQDLSELLYPNGAVYAARVSAWKQEPGFYVEPVAGYQMPAARSLEIDEPWELELVRAYMTYTD